MDNNITLSELEPFIKGKKFTGEAKEREPLSRQSLKDFLDMLNQQVMIKQFFNVYEKHTEFYNKAVDFKALVPKNIQKEVFYAAKLGKFYPQVPSQAVYMVKKAWEASDGIPNLIPKLLPLKLLDEMFKSGYFMGSVSLYDVICNICDSGDSTSIKYKPLSDYNLKNRHNNFTELYIKSTDMVAAVPNSIGDSLAESDIENITLGADGLEIKGKLLRTMGGYVGAINSYYDLRELI